MALRLAFSTLGCPAWSIDQVGEGARSAGYEGVELRLLDGEIIPADLPRVRRDEIKRALAGIEICGLGTSCRFTYPDADERAKNRADCERYMELADDLGCPMVRV